MQILLNITIHILTVFKTCLTAIDPHPHRVAITLAILGPRGAIHIQIFAFFWLCKSNTILLKRSEGFAISKNKNPECKIVLGNYAIFIILLEI